MIFSDFFKALRQMFDPAFRRVLLLGIALTVVLLVALAAAFLWSLQFWLPEAITIPYLGEFTGIGALLTGGAFVLMLILSVFLMVPVASVFTGFFLDDVTDAVERKHYPNLPPTLNVPIYDQFKDAFNFFALLVAINIIALIVALFIGPLAPILFWAVNGFLLGREYFTLVAMRRLGREGAQRLRARHSAQVWMAGILMAIPLSVPLVNLVVPVLGVATFTHLFHRLNR